MLSCHLKKPVKGVLLERHLHDAPRVALAQRPQQRFRPRRRPRLTRVRGLSAVDGADLSLPRGAKLERWDQKVEAAGSFPRGAEARGEAAEETRRILR